MQARHGDDVVQRIDGVPATGSKYLMTDILRHEWNFTGFVVTDYTSIMEMIPHGVAEDTACRCCACP